MSVCCYKVVSSIPTARRLLRFVLDVMSWMDEMDVEGYRSKVPDVRCEIIYSSCAAIYELNCH